MTFPDYITPETITENVRLALAEDIGSGDITAQLIPAEQTATARIISNEAAVLCGSAWATETFRQLAADTRIEWHASEGDDLVPGKPIATVHGNARVLLTGERTALNFLQTLSGTATTARFYADKATQAGVRILDTRKTIPGLRLAQKYAVLCGGAGNHRIGLFDAFLIKENHIAACGSITRAIQQARQIRPDALLEIEVETLDELEEAIRAKPDRIMLDNFSAEHFRKAITLVPEDIELECSGNLTDANLAFYGQRPGCLVSSGAITKHLKAIDFSMRIVTDA